MAKSNAAVVTLAANSEAINGVSKMTKSVNLKLHFSNVCYTIKQTKSKSMDILKDNCGELRSGSLTAILGPSGAGKTSILNVLSGFKAKGVTGVFKLNGKERNLLEFRKICSYIPQDFALLDLLTVHETLKVSADLKLPSETTSTTEKLEIIANTIKILNMEDCSHTLVRDLSGGERKRLSIGIELITNPPIMFFDEPTSGLDSVASLQIINYLHRLAHEGRIIVCVIHQPSSKLIKLFDDILIMSKGEVLYSGDQQSMLKMFAKANYECPNYYNPADFVLEVASEEHNGNIAALIQRNKSKYCDRGKEPSDFGHVEETTKMLCNNSPEHTSIEMKQHTDSAALELSNSTNFYCDAIRPKTSVSFGCQFSVLIIRSFRTLMRNGLSVQLRLLMHILIGMLVGVVFWNIGNDGAKVLTNSSCIIFMVMFVFFGNSMPSVLLCPQDMGVFLREYLNGWYSLPAYYSAKVIADLPMQFICPTSFIFIVYFMTGQINDIGRFAMCWGVMVMISIIGHFFGLVCGSTFGLHVAIFMVPALTIPLLVFSGFFIRIHELAGFLRPICDISFFRYTMEAFMQAIYGYDRPNLECNADFCYFKSPSKFLTELDMAGDRYGIDVLALLIFIVTMKVLLFLSLMWRIKKTQ